MTRGKLRFTLVNDDGDVQDGQAVVLRKPGTSSPIGNAVYAAASGGVDIGATGATDANGTLEVYLDEGRVLDIYASDADTTFENEVVPWNPGAVWGDPKIVNVRSLDVVGDGVSDDWTAIQAVLTAAVDGQTVLVPDGDYLLSDELTITGLSHVKVVLAPNATIRQSTATKAGLVLSSCSYVTVEGGRFIGPDSTPLEGLTHESGIRISGGSHNTVRGVYFDDWGQQAITSSGDYTEVAGCTAFGNASSSLGLVEYHVGIHVTGGYANVHDNTVEGFVNNINLSGVGTRHRVVNNHCIGGEYLNTNIYGAVGSYSIYEGNILDASAASSGSCIGLKTGFTSYSPQVRGNTFISCPCSLTQSFGAVVEDNVLDEGYIILGADGNDGLRTPFAPRIAGNTVRETPYALDGSTVLGAITVRGRYAVIEGNTLEWSHGAAIAAYDATGYALLGIEILDNQIRQCGVRAGATHDNTIDAIKIGGNGENVTGLRVIGNSITSKASATSANAVTVSGSTTVTLTSATEVNTFEPGDYLSGTGITAGTRVTAINGTAATLTLDVAATASGTITLTRAATRMRYGLNVQAGSGDLEAWGNTFANAATGDVLLSGATLAPMTVRGRLFVGGVASSSKNTAGLTVTQGAADDEIVTGKSSDVAHGMTDQVDTDTFVKIAKFSATAGGANLVGATEGTVGLALWGLQTTENTTKSSAAVAAVQIEAYTKSGTNVAAAGADSNLLTVGSNGAARFILDADGDSHQDVGTAWTNFDTHDDLAILNSLAAAVARPESPIGAEFSRWLSVHREQLETLRLVTFNDGPDGDGRAFVNMSRLTMLLAGAARQLGLALGSVRDDVAALKAELRSLSDGMGSG